MLSCIYIYKEDLKTVVCELLACTQPNCHETFTALWNPYSSVLKGATCANTLQSRSTRRKTRK